MPKQDRHLLKRTDSWHYNRRVPRRYASIEHRSFVRSSLRTKSIWEWAMTVPEMYQDDGQTMAAAKNKPAGSAEAAKIYPAIVDLMWESGYSDADIKKVLGGNLMRVYGQVWG